MTEEETRREEVRNMYPGRERWAKKVALMDDNQIFAIFTRNREDIEKKLQKEKEPECDSSQMRLLDE
jgi:hypothetical protein